MTSSNAPCTTPLFSGLLVAAMFSLAAAVPGQDLAKLADAHAVVFREVEGVALRLFLFRPSGWQPTDRRPAVVFFFGGGWVGGSPDQFAPQARYLATRGMVAACAEYRVRNRHGTTPQDAVADAQAAVGWLSRHAPEQGVDAGRIAAAGGSAGGHLAACAGLTPFCEAAAVDVRPAALVLFNPVLDTGPEGFARERVGEHGVDISPVHHVGRTAPPTLVLHGTADRTVPFAQAEAFAAAMAEADVRCDLLAYEGRGHGFFNPARGQRDFVTAARAMDRFFSSLGWLSGAPTLAEDGVEAWRGYTRRDVAVDGYVRTVVAPDFAAPGRPWIWRAGPFEGEPLDAELLRRGFHVVHCDVAELHGDDEALRRFDATLDWATSELDLAQRTAFAVTGSGALTAYRWAARHPDRVACIYADTPVCDIRSWPGGNPIDVLQPLAAAGVPLLHVCREDDETVPITENTAVLAGRYAELDGTVDVIVTRTVGRDAPTLAEPQPLVDFVLRHAVEAGDFSKLRGGIARSLARMRAQGRGRVAFLGGSITHNAGWRELVGEDLRRRLEGVELECINAGIGSFGSTEGAFRLRTDVLARGPVDLLFVEAAVNDEGQERTPVQMVRGMEGIVRAVRRESPLTDIVMLHFADPGKLARIRRGEVPAVITAHESVAERYDIPSIDLAAEVTWRIERGEFSWQEDFKSLHPSPFGQRLYAASVERLLDRGEHALPGEAGPRPLPSPVDPHCYQFGRLVAPGATGGRSGFELDPRWRPDDGAGTRAGFVGVPVLAAARAGATCAFRFDGTACGVLVTAGPDAGVIGWSIDDGAWQSLDLFTRASRRLHLPRCHVLAAGLAPGTHELRVRVEPRPAGTRGDHAVRIVKFLVN